ncbi:uncharacterized protein LOC130628670 [Hydractinia symbiolongicarpus]|uniref:uncharacterized protein LOC130628670 n=1 Tax=Hydractinia symbiolongicarpus TaxID=13093 RepID=UPI00254E07CC|nr:uncharacterized protein LOC130628670 [Hydractinia symbiolongicarpus]
MKKGSGGPVALETTLGWVLSGKCESCEEQKQDCLQTQHVMKVEVEKKNELLRNELKKFWQVESVGGQEISVINDFENHVYHDGSRYVTRLPFKPDHDPLPDNYFVSEQRLRSTAKKLHALGIYDDYDNIFKQYVQEDIIEKVGRDEVIRESGNVHYLPHRAVVRVAFGLTSSPFLLNGTIRQHLNKFLDMYSEIVKKLGLPWDKHTDCFLFDFNVFIRKSKACSFTKSNVLNLSASMYDPLGIISPITAESGIKARWIDLLEKIEFLNVDSVPRFSFVDWTEAVSAELHGFCDSSLSLYCALVYVKIVTKDVTRAIAGRINIDRIVGWTDSQVALCWIREKERTWKPWIENRVVKIRKIVPPDKWFHVAGVENPTDPPTRSIDDFVSIFNGIWFNGHSFLLNDNIHYDVPTDFSKTEVEKELKASTDIQNVLTVTEQNALDLNEIVDFFRYGSLNKLIHVVAYVIRFKNNLIAKIRKNEESNNNENLNVDEVTKSLDHIVYYNDIAHVLALKAQGYINKIKLAISCYN